MVIPTVLELFYQELASLATVLVIPTVLEFFYQELASPATVLVIPTVLEILNPLRWPRGFRQCRAPSWLKSDKI